MCNLALTYWNQEKWKEAEEVGVQVVETQKRVLGRERHLNGKFPPPKEANTSVRASILLVFQ
jgi:hypothetical protein